MRVLNALNPLMPQSFGLVDQLIGALVPWQGTWLVACWLTGCAHLNLMLWSGRPSLGWGRIVVFCPCWPTWLLYSAPAGPRGSGPRGSGPRGSGLHCVDSDWGTELPGTFSDVNHHLSATVFPHRYLSVYNNVDIETSKSRTIAYWRWRYTRRHVAELAKPGLSLRNLA